MLDAVQLGKFIAANADNLDAALGMHEKEMFLRSKAEAAETHVAIDYILGENAPHALIAFFRPSTANEKCAGDKPPCQPDANRLAWRTLAG
jgi:hypothetical protein